MLCRCPDGYREQKRLFGFCLKGWLVRLGQKPMCRLRVGIKLLAYLICLLAVLVNRFAYLNLKKCAVGKIKNTEGSAMSVGLLAVRLKYGLYVGHLSKWFVCVNSFMFWSSV
jgi:hypothetical protein